MDNYEKGRTLAWFVRAVSGAGIAFLIPLMWTISQQIEVQNTQIERNTRMIERLIDAIFKDYNNGEKASTLPRRQSDCKIIRREVERME